VAVNEAIDTSALSAKAVTGLGSMRSSRVRTHNCLHGRIRANKVLSNSSEEAVKRRRSGDVRDTLGGTPAEPTCRSDLAISTPHRKKKRK
jgi:hypothetical protein